jgi:hypothetical protein
MHVTRLGAQLLSHAIRPTTAAARVQANAARTLCDNKFNLKLIHTRNYADRGLNVPCNGDFGVLRSRHGFRMDGIRNTACSAELLNTVCSAEQLSCVCAGQSRCVHGVQVCARTHLGPGSARIRMRKHQLHHHPLWQRLLGAEIAFTARESDATLRTAAHTLLPALPPPSPARRTGAAPEGSNDHARRRLHCCHPCCHP